MKKWLVAYVRLHHEKKTAEKEMCHTPPVVGEAVRVMKGPLKGSEGEPDGSEWKCEGVGETECAGGTPRRLCRWGLWER